MPVTFARLRIAGFKSFAEPVSVEILPGLTGIVGPNGCGKSNVVEALRWCMGENSARSLRGGEMDDLIFAGTAARAPRNLAEVVLTLEDASGLAPPPLHDQAELQIGRRIERGAGSAYRINGRDARARDVQTLFADLASGARSSAMVSQGRVAAIVGARPEERRSVLEEAAGITGLHARRHEAELKLRATEGNLARAEDLRLQIEERTKALSGQAEQASRYRAVAEELRTREQGLLALLHARATQAVQFAGAARIEAEQARAVAEAALMTAIEAEQATADRVQAPREDEALARTLLERRRIEAEGAAREDERALRESEAASRRLDLAKGDCEAAEARQEDAAREVERLDGERTALDQAQASLPDRLRAADHRLAAAATAVLDADRASRRDATAASEAGTRLAEHRRDAEAAGARLSRATAVLDEIDAARRQADTALPEPGLLPRLDAALREAQDALRGADTVLDEAISARSVAARQADAARLVADDAVRQHRAALQEETEAETRLDRLRTEAASVQARLAEADRNLVSETERDRMHDRVLAADQALADAATALNEADASRSIAAAARLEAQARSRDGARARAQAEADARRTGAACTQAVAEHAQARRDRDAAVSASVPDVVLAEAVAARTEAEAALATIGQTLHAAEAGHAQAQADADAHAETLATLREMSARLSAEAEGLAQALAPVPSGTAPVSSSGADRDADSVEWLSLAELLEVPQGLEVAVAAALADGLDAGCGVDAPRSWLFLPALPADALPSEATPLSELVPAPEQLDRALSRVGLIDPGSDGDALQRGLRPGQCLVTRDGALWRWDGYRVAAFQPSPAAIRLQQRARHRDVLAGLARANEALEPAIAASVEAQRRRDAAAVEVQDLRRSRAGTEQALARARDEESRLSLLDAQNRARLQALQPRLVRAETMLAELEAARTAAAAVLEGLPRQDALDREAGETMRAEAVATEREQQARAIRVEADAALQQARAGEAALSARHATHDTARRALVPASARLVEDVAAAELALVRVRDRLGSVVPDQAMQAAEAATAASEQAGSAEQDARTARDGARIAVAEGRSEQERVAAILRDGQGRIASLEARRLAAAIEHQAAETDMGTVEDKARALPDATLAADAAQVSEAALAEAREAERDAGRERSALGAEEAALSARRDPLDAALSDWSRRLDGARAIALEAGQRFAEARQEASARRIDPAAAAAREEAIATALSRAEAEHAEAASRLERAEDAARTAQRDSRDADAALAARREAALRADGRDEQAREILSRLLADHPEPPAIVVDDLSDGAETSLRRKVASLIRERDAMGPVNLRADLELAEAIARMEAIATEREEIDTAIARLRGQIGQLNREGRERLLAVFEQVDRHFQSLFARMFSGGRAHLGMVGSDDPLEAGLEIYAQPPGKKLATLSLLSGGEQALTALSLVFAVFRCNPAPICVLDEVDAPLDDANVERFCALLGDMVREAGTRFLVVTHHQLTMAHMDRLYGVTMQERGVSRVLSVDLAAAAAMVD